MRGISPKRNAARGIEAVDRFQQTRIRELDKVLDVEIAVP